MCVPCYLHTSTLVCTVLLASHIYTCVHHATFTHPYLCALCYLHTSILVCTVLPSHTHLYLCALCYLYTSVLMCTVLPSHIYTRVHCVLPSHICSCMHCATFTHPHLCSFIELCVLASSMCEWVVLCCVCLRRC